MDAYANALDLVRIQRLEEVEDSSEMLIESPLFFYWVILKNAACSLLGQLEVAWELTLNGVLS